MFSREMINTWEVATIVAIVAGIVGFFVVLRGASFVAHAVPNASFAGAAGATLIGLNTIFGLGVFALASALGIGWLSKRGRSDAVTALILTLMLAIGALFLSWSSEYASQVYSLLFGEVLGVASNDVGITTILGAVAVIGIMVFYRPLLLSSVVPDIAQSKRINIFRVEIIFLLIVALVSTMAVPVVGTLLMFTLMVGPPASARSFADSPRVVIIISVTIALIIVWLSVIISYATDWPIGFYVGTLGVVSFLMGRIWSHARSGRGIE